MELFRQLSSVNAESGICRVAACGRLGNCAEDVLPDTCQGNSAPRGAEGAPCRLPSGAGLPRGLLCAPVCDLRAAPTHSLRERDLPFFFLSVGPAWRHGY